jgi:hypothetical protein
LVQVSENSIKTPLPVGIDAPLAGAVMLTQPAVGVGVDVGVGVRVGAGVGVGVGVRVGVGDAAISLKVIVAEPSRLPFCLNERTATE